MPSPMQRVIKVLTRTKLKAVDEAKACDYQYRHSNDDKLKAYWLEQYRLAMIEVDEVDHRLREAIGIDALIIGQPVADTKRVA